MMEGKREPEPFGGWTFTTLLRFVIDRMDERDRRYEQRFRAQEEAVSKAEHSTEKRLEGMNEFRSQLKDQQATFVTRAELLALGTLIAIVVSIIVAIVFHLAAPGA